MTRELFILILMLVGHTAVVAMATFAAVVGDVVWFVICSFFAACYAAVVILLASILSLKSKQIELLETAQFIRGGHK